MCALRGDLVNWDCRAMRQLIPHVANGGIPRLIDVGTFGKSVSGGKFKEVFATILYTPTLVQQVISACRAEAQN